MVTLMRGNSSPSNSVRVIIHRHTCVILLLLFTNRSHFISHSSFTSWLEQSQDCCPPKKAVSDWQKNKNFDLIFFIIFFVFVSGDCLHMRPDRDHINDHGVGLYGLVDGRRMEAGVVHALHRRRCPPTPTVQYAGTARVLPIEGCR